MYLVVPLSQDSISVTWLKNLTDIIQRCRGRWSFTGHVSLAQTTIDHELGGIDEAALITGQKQDGLGLLNGLSEAAIGKMDLSAVPLLEVIAQPVLQQGGVERAGAQGVEADILAGMDDGEFAGHGQDGALGGGVCELWGGGAHEGDEAGHVDDAAGLLLVAAHAEHGVLAAVPDALDVDGLRQVPDLLRRVDGVVVLRVHDARIVEDDVDAAVLILGFNRRRHVGFLGHVALDRRDARAVRHQLLDLLERLGQRRLGNVRHQHRGPLAGEEDGGFQSDASGAAGDDGVFASQAAWSLLGGHAISWCFWSQMITERDGLINGESLFKRRSGR